MCCLLCVVFFKQKTAYELRISDWGSDVCSSDLPALRRPRRSGVGGIEAGRRSRRRGADAGAGIRAGQPLSSTTSAARWRRRQRGGRGERHGYESRVATALAGAVAEAVGAKVQLRTDLPDRHSRKSGRSEERRGGKEWVSKCRSRWSPFCETKKTK